MTLSGLAKDSSNVFRVATYNVENYLLESIGTRPLKPEASRQQVQQSILELQADMIAIQELGGLPAIRELQSALDRNGLHYPHVEWAFGHDTNICVAILSRFPFTERRSVTNLSYLMLGKRYEVNRAFLEVECHPTPDYAFTLMTAHLKSRRVVADANEAELRYHEAVLLRKKIDDCFRRNPKVNLVVVGDFNDTKDSSPIRTLLGKGATALIDTRPAEQEGVRTSEVESEDGIRKIAWTHFYAKEDTYSRVDYILISRGMYHEWVRGNTFVLRKAQWGLASDHRPVVAAFFPLDTGVLHSP